MIGGAYDDQGTSNFGHRNTVSRDPYQYSELMRLRRDLRLKRGAARAMDRKTGAQGYEGPRSSRLVLHSGSTTRGEEVNEQAVIPN